MSEHDHDPGMCFRPPGEGICPGCRADAERDTIARVVAFLRRAACVYDGAPRAVLEANASLIEEGHWRNDDDREVQHLANEYRAVAAEEREACARGAPAASAREVRGERVQVVRRRHGPGVRVVPR